MSSRSFTILIILALSWGLLSTRAGAQGYARLAPYQAIRWAPEVRIDGRWHTIRSIGGVAVEEILAITHGNRRYQSFLRQRRFDHDLMQILGTMGHKPDEAVKLVVRDPGTGKEKTIEYPPVRWTPEVQLNDHWYALRSIDALPVEKILASAKNKDDDGWQRRFEEDIVEVLGEMGHKPGKTVRLALFDLETRKEKTLDAPMTEENRESLRAFRERVADLNPKALRPETG